MTGSQLSFLAPLVCILPLVAIARPVLAAEPRDVSPEQIRKSIERGVAFLKDRQDKVRGEWQELPENAYPGGVTSLCTLALLNAGVKPNDPAIVRALDSLRGLGRPEKTYTTSLQTMVFCAAEPEKDRLLIRRNVKWLEVAQVKDGDDKGGWSYGNRGDVGGSADPSNTQFALLALHEAERAGVEVSEQTWALAIDYWKRKQNKGDGSWGYEFNNQPNVKQGRGSMTAAGISSLVIAQGHYRAGDASVQNGQVACCGSVAEQDEVDKGLRWLGSFPDLVGSHPGMQHGGSWLLYYLYALERAGRVTGHRYIGNHDWYREGATELVRKQDTLNGQWLGPFLPESKSETLSTSFALLFLSKGRWPILIGRLQTERETGINDPSDPKGQNRSNNDWNQHRSALQSLTRYVEAKWKRDLAWQNVVLDLWTAKERIDPIGGKYIPPAPKVEDLLQTPVLFLSGRKALNLSPANKELLKQYVNQGGFLFAEACDGSGCNGTEFDASFRALMAELFPDSQLRPLPADHAIWHAEERILPDPRWPILALNTCCRTSVIYCPRTLSCYWALHRGLRPMNYPENVKADISWCSSLGINVLAYATNRELKFKDELMNVQVTVAATDPQKRGVLRLAKLSHGGGSDDAPSAVPNLLKVVKQQLDMRVNTQVSLLPTTDPKLAEYPVVYIHGRQNFSFSPAEQKALAEFVARGGVIIGDSICASPQFAASFRKQMELIFPEKKLARLPAEHTIFSSEFRGFDLKSVTLRDPQARAGNEPIATRLTKGPPLLEGLEVDGRLVVIFSPNDLSCGLENGASPECRGYIKEDAARIAVNMLLYALQQ